MKRYLLFAGHGYYPLGGWEDFHGFFDSFDAAKEAYQALKLQGIEWFHVVDSTTWETCER